MKVSVAEARNQLTKLIHAVENGEHVTICRHGKPVADLIASKADQRQKPKFGTLKGKAIVIDPDWWKPQEDIEAWLRGDV